MKKPFLQKILYLFPLLAIHVSSIAQKKTTALKPDRFGFDLSFGVAVPTSKAVNDVFYTGLDASLGFKIAVLNSKKLWIKPLGGTKLYSKKAGSDNAVREAFRTWKAGIELQYRAADVKKFSFYPLLRADYNWCSNYFSKTYDYDITTNSQTIAISDNYLKGTGYSFDAGIMITRKTLYLKIDYEYSKPTLNVHPDFIKAARDLGIIVPASTKLNCSSLNIGLGINFNFK